MSGLVTYPGLRYTTLTSWYINGRGEVIVSWVWIVSSEFICARGLHLLVSLRSIAWPRDELTDRILLPQPYLIKYYRFINRLVYLLKIKPRATICFSERQIWHSALKFSLPNSPLIVKSIWYVRIYGLAQGHTHAKSDTWINVLVVNNSDGVSGWWLWVGL